MFIIFIFVELTCDHRSWWYLALENCEVYLSFALFNNPSTHNDQVRSLLDRETHHRRITKCPRLDATLSLTADSLPLLVGLALIIATDPLSVLVERDS